MDGEFGMPRKARAGTGKENSRAELRECPPKCGPHPAVAGQPTGLCRVLGQGIRPFCDQEGSLQYGQERGWGCGWG